MQSRGLTSPDNKMSPYYPQMSLRTEINEFLLWAVSQKPEGCSRQRPYPVIESNYNNGLPFTATRTNREGV